MAEILLPVELAKAAAAMLRQLADREGNELGYPLPDTIAAAERLEHLVSVADTFPESTAVDSQVVAGRPPSGQPGDLCHRQHCTDEDRHQLLLRLDGQTVVHPCACHRSPGWPEVCDIGERIERWLDSLPQAPKPPGRYWAEPAGPVFHLEPVAPPIAECEHESATGDDDEDGPDKVWRCDLCGWRFRYVEDPDGPISLGGGRWRHEGVAP